jgi:hypothetical protein
MPVFDLNHCLWRSISVTSDTGVAQMIDASLQM